MTPPLLVHETVRERIDRAMAAEALSGGWLITGPPQIGKRRLADAIAAAVLSPGETALASPDANTEKLIGHGAHPDYFVLSRQPHPTSGGLKREIVIDDVRGISNRLHQTSSTGRRVLIVDLADDLNRAAANGLLKTLEEPPANTLMLLLSAAPGRLLPTIKSRCRKLSMFPMPQDAVERWLETTCSVGRDQARSLASTAGGRPGRAISLAGEEGAAAQSWVDTFLSAAAGDGDLLGTAKAIGERGGEEIWEEARPLLLAQFQKTLSAVATGDDDDTINPRLARLDVGTLIELNDSAARLVARGTALNADRTQIVLNIGMTISDMLKRRPHHAGR